MDSLFIQLVGLTAAILASAMFIPQAWRVWQDRSDPHALEGVSPLTNVIVGVQGCLWVVYNSAMGAWWGVLPNLFLVPLSLFILLILRRAKRLPPKLS